MKVKVKIPVVGSIDGLCTSWWKIGRKFVTEGLIWGEMFGFGVIKASFWALQAIGEY